MNARDQWKALDRARRIADPTGPCRTPRNGLLDLGPTCDAGLNGWTAAHVRLRVKAMYDCDSPGWRSCWAGVWLYTIPAKDLRVPEWARVDIRFGGVQS